MGRIIIKYLISLPGSPVCDLVLVWGWGNEKRMGNPILRYLIRVESMVQGINMQLRFEERCLRSSGRHSPWILTYSEIFQAQFEAT
jgi:hypothetical protein